MRWNAEGQALCRELRPPERVTQRPRRQGRTEKEAIAISRIKALDYAERLINRPRGETPVAIRRNKNGYSLLYSGRVLTKTHASGVGEMQAQAMALALGIELPTEIGGETTTNVGSGVLYRAIGASSLDLRRPEAHVVLEQLLSTAALQRGVFNTLEIG